MTIRYAARQARVEARRGLPQEQRLWLLEQDNDENDREHESLRDELKQTNRILTGMLATLASAVIVGIVNLILGTV